jgi:uncharacterized damage-inducible protein DinB
VISPDVARSHLAYTEWATARILAAARELSSAELARDFGTANKSVLGTLTHVFGADRVWLARLEGGAQEWPREYDLAGLESDWIALYARWRSWAAGRDETTLAERVDYRDLKGNPWVSPVWQIVLHVVNHGTHHRGQVAGFLRSMGKTPPPLDLIAYYRQTGG